VEFVVVESAFVEVAVGVVGGAFALLEVVGELAFVEVFVE